MCVWRPEELKMTLLTTEILMEPHPIIVFAADRRISRGNRRDSERRKIFRVPTKRAGIGYFGLAELRLAGRRRYMDEWLTDFLNRHSGLRTLGDLADRLAEELNRIVPSKDRQREVSGFHLAGFNDRDEPEFWFVRNVDDDRATILGSYSAREDFQRHGRAQLRPRAALIYRNGDLRAHAAAWAAIDASFGELLRLPDFNPGAGPVQRARWVRFKMEIIAHFYQHYSCNSIIGKPIDAFVVTLSGVRAA
jgi:hypothetical protein